MPTKFPRFSSLLSCFCLCLMVMAGTDFVVAAPLRCGAAAVDVTPRQLPVIRNGGFLEATDTRVLDPLHARCVVLDDGSVRLAIVVVDSCMIPLDVCDRAKKLAQHRTGIEPERMMISATHTHTAPSVMDYCLGSRADQAYRKFLPGKIAEAIEVANQRLEPAQLAWTKLDASSHTKCRRWITRSDKMLVDPFGESTVHAMMHPGHQNAAYTGPSGPIDPWLSFLMVQSPQGHPIALLANFSMHYYSGHAGVSADYYGRFAKGVAQRLAAGNPNFVGIMSQGTSGDLWWGDYSAPRDQRPFENMDQFTDQLVDAVVKATPNLEYQSDVTLAMAEERLTLARRVPDARRLAWARRLNRLRGDRLPRDRPEVYALQAVYLHENPTDDVVLQAVRIGDLGITAMPNEVYALTGLKIKRQSPLPTTFNVSLANGACGYIPPPEQHALGGYTTWPARTASLEVEAEPKIVAGILRLLEQLADKPRRDYQEAETTYSKRVLASGPTAFWRCSEMQGPAGTDATGNGHTLRYAGQLAYHLPGRDGPFGEKHNTHAVHLAGGKLVADHLNLGESYTVEFSFYVATPNDFRDVTAHLLSRGSDRVLITGASSETPGRLAIGDHVGRTPVPSHSWQHVVVVRNGDFVQLFLNGDSEAEISQKIPLAGPLPNRIFVGGDAGDTANLEGKLDDISAYERALSRSEIIAHARAAGLHAASGAPAGTKLLDTAPLEPEASLQRIHVRDGYRVELVAAEPLVQDPVAIDWGADGRLWIAEMADYPMGMDGEGKPGGRIRWLEDTDQDGRYDKSVVFMQDVSFPNGVMAWRDGVLVTAAPEIFYAEDQTGDGIADVKETLFSGFVEGNQQLRVNGLRWGLDNWIHCASGAHHAGFGASTEILCTKLGLRQRLGSRDFRFRPDRGRLDPQSGPSQYGRVRDDWGNWFGVQNSQPLWHYVLADQYTRRNADVPTVDPRRQVRTPRMPRVYSAKPPQKRFHGFDHAGHYTSACGISIYRDDILFPRSESHAFTCEPFHNLVQHHVLTDDSTSFRGRRADDGPIDFFASSDRWTRPVMTRTGPDGALWVVDMYRYMIEHPEWLPAAGKEELRPGYRAGAGLGRIYRIVPEARGARDMPRLADRSPPELVESMAHPNGLVRDMAHRMLLETWTKDEAGRLNRMALDHPLAEVRLQALCLLDGLGQLSSATLASACEDTHAAVRRHALRIAEPYEDQEIVRTAVLRLAGDRHPRVRLQLACTLGQWSHEEAGRTLAQLAMRQDNDRFTIAAIVSSAGRHYTPLIDVAVASPERVPDELFNALLLMGEGNRDELARLLIAEIERGGAQLNEASAHRIARWLDLLHDRDQSPALLRTKRESDKLARVLGRLANMTEQARRVALDEAAAVTLRTAAVRLLAREADKFDADVTLLGSLLSPQQPLPIQTESLRALSRIPIAPVAVELVSAWPQLLPTLRLQAADILASRTSWALVLLGAMEQGDVEVMDLDLALRQRLLQSRHREVAEMARKVFKKTEHAPRAEVLNRYESAVSLVGSKPRGSQLFEKNCKICHPLDKGQSLVGPDLRTLTNRSPRALLTAIFDPNQSIEPRYHSYHVVLQSGEQLVGLVDSEDATSIALVDAQGKRRVVLRSAIEQLQRSKLSLMPEGFELKLAPSDAADLIAYLADLGGA